MYPRNFPDNFRDSNMSAPCACIVHTRRVEWGQACFGHEKFYITTMFSATALAKKVQKSTAHVAVVDIPPTMRTQWTPERIFKVLKRMARLPFANRIKEPFWLLVYNGVHVQSRYASTPNRQRRCRCGSQDDSLLSGSAQ